MFNNIESRHSNICRILSFSFLIFVWSFFFIFFLKYHKVHARYNVIIKRKKKVNALIDLKKIPVSYSSQF